MAQEKDSKPSPWELPAVLASVEAPAVAGCAADAEQPAPTGRKVAVADDHTNEMVERIGELARLEDGWLDGRGVAPTRQAVRAAEHFATMLVLVGGRRRPGIFPGEDGGIHFEWMPQDFQHLGLDEDYVVDVYVQPDGSMAIDLMDLNGLPG